MVNRERNEEPSDEELDRTCERADEIRESFAELYTDYHASQRCATEILNVDPETWLAFHPEGPTVFEVVADMIDDQREIELANRISTNQSPIFERVVEPVEALVLAEINDVVGRARDTGSGSEAESECSTTATTGFEERSAFHSLAGCDSSGYFLLWVLSINLHCEIL